MRTFYRRLSIALALLFIAACGTEKTNSPLVVTWKFAAGDCASNGVEKVRVQATRSFASPVSAEAVCTAQRVELGQAQAGSYSISAQGLDAKGAVVSQSYGASLNLSAGAPGDITITLYPKAANVKVSWNGCPSGVVLPYYITLYKPPAQAGGALTDEVASVQESCSTRTATLTNVPPGQYVVEVDSRAVTPKVQGTAEVTVVAGSDAEVTVNVP